MEKPLIHYTVYDVQGNIVGSVFADSTEVESGTSWNSTLFLRNGLLVATVWSPSTFEIYKAR